MNFMLDENFPASVKELLKTKNIEVFDIRGTDLESLSDREIIKISIDKKAIFLTTDKDFYHTIHMISKPHYGIVVIALRRPNSNNINKKVEWFLNNYELDNMENRCLLILDEKCKVFC